MLIKQSVQVKTPIIIVFGPSGAGKSSVINMLPGVQEDAPQAITSSSAQGVTITSTPYFKNINGKIVKLFDTAGLNEGSLGSVPGIQAIESLHNLILSIPPDGISLLAFVLPAARITALTKQNYTMFWDTICHKQVKIVVIITGLEDEENMDDWWEANISVFEDYGMVFDGHACITSSPSFPELYTTSSKQVVSLLHDSLEGTTPWVPSPAHWLADLLLKPAFRSPKLLNSSLIRDLSPDLKRAISSYIAETNEDLSGDRRMLHNEASKDKDGDSVSIVALATVTEESARYVQHTGWNTNINIIPFNVDNLDIDSGMNKTIMGIYRMLHNIGNQSINLLLMVIPASEMDQRKWKIVYDVLYKRFIQQLIPIALLITDPIEDSDEQWRRIKGTLDDNSMFFHHHSFASKLQEREEVVAMITKLIEESYSPISYEITDPDMGASDLVRSFVFWGKIGIKTRILIQELYDAFVDDGKIEHMRALDSTNVLGREYYRQHLLKFIRRLPESTRSHVVQPLANKVSCCK